MAKARCTDSGIMPEAPAMPLSIAAFFIKSRLDCINFSSTNDNVMFLCVEEHDVALFLEHQAGLNLTDTPWTICAGNTPERRGAAGHTRWSKVGLVKHIVE